MFNRTVLALNDAAHRLPTSAFFSALLLVIAAPATQAASINNANNGWANHSINPAADCHSDIEAQTFHPKYQNPQRGAIDCMLTELRVYQQNDKSARQQYLAYKAQAWLNYAYHEDNNQSKSAVGSQALQAGVTILQALQNGTDESLSITADIPTSSALMRPDLWATLNALKDSNGIKAAAQELAFSEVALIWAAADQCKQGSQPSGTRFRKADRWLEQAREAYVNTHDSKTNVALEALINRYYKQYALLDTGNDICHGQVLPTSIQKSPSTQILQTEINRTFRVAKTTRPIPMPVPTATYQLVY